MTTNNSQSTLTSNSMYHMVPTSSDSYEARNSCKLRRQHPVKRESSRRIAVRPVIQRRREPSISSSCESLDESRPPLPSIAREVVRLITDSHGDVIKQ